jgi:hypothetical protein
LSQRRITIGANSEHTEKAEGRFLAIFSATGAFNVIADNGAERPLAAGRKVTLPPNTRRIRFIDKSGAANTVVFDNDDEDIFGDTSPGAGQSSSTASSTVLARMPATANEPLHDGSLADASAATTLARSNRVSYIVSNLEAAGARVLHLVNGAGTTIFYIFPRETREYFTSEELYLRNDSGAAIICSFAQKYYT